MWRTLLLLLVAIAAAPAAAAPVQVVIGTAAGTPGGSVAVEVRVDPAGQTVVGAGNDIELDPPLAFGLRPDGGFDCAGSPSQAPLLPPTFTCISPPPGPCTRLRAIVFRPVGGGVLSAGPLYGCRIDIGAAAAPGVTLPLRIRAARSTGAVGRALDTAGTAGAVTVLAPTPTATATDTPVPTATPTATPSLTPTVTATRTVTRTRTATRTPRTPLPTPTGTATPVVGLRVEAGLAPPGGHARLAVSITDRAGSVTGVTADLLLPAAVFDVEDVAASCAIDARLAASHSLSATAVGDPPVSPDLRRLRLVVSERRFPPGLLGAGALLACDAPLRPEAPSGAWPMALDRLFAADADGTLVLGVSSVPGLLTVDPGAPSPTPPPSRTPAASATAPPSPTAAATATATRPVTPTPSPTAPMPMPTPTPTATAPGATPTAPVPCAGDCDADGSVAIDELVRAVAIATGEASPRTCAPLDADGDGAVSIGEVVAAVTGALAGCR